MSRIERVPANKASPFARIAYFMCKRRLGQVLEPIAVTANHPRLLRGYAHMEMAQEAATTIDARLKLLCDVKAAMLVGCPF